MPLVYFGQTNLTFQSPEQIEKSIQKSNTLKNARSDLSIDSIENESRQLEKQLDLACQAFSFLGLILNSLN